MWSRYELKRRAKEVLRRCFWPAVFVCFISALLCGEFNSNRGSTNSNHSNSYIWDQDEYVSDAQGTATDIGINLGKRVGMTISGILTGGLAPLFIIAGMLFFVLGVIVLVLIGAPIMVGANRFFMCSRERQTGISEILYAFKSGGVMNVVLTMFIMRVKILLWTLLLIIPGVIKSYEYMLVPYILSENPTMDQARVFELSRGMMNGQKWNAFVLDLSFILWAMLGAVTCGLANILFVNPYRAATAAELYSVLRNTALHDGQTNTYELPGYAED